MSIHTRAVVIGGGVYGCGLLYHLVHSGWKDAVLVEKNELTAGSTWHAAGFCTHYTFNLTHGHMRKYSTELYRHLETDLVEPTGYHRCRGIRVTSDPDRLDEFRHGLSVGRQLGIEFAMLGPREIAEAFPMMDTRGLCGGIFEPLDGYVDPAQTTQAMARQARAGGARILRNNPVTGVEPTPSGEWRVRTPGEEIIAEHLVIASGFWANEVGKMLGLDLPIVPMLHQYLVTEDIPAVAQTEPERIPLVRYHDKQWYLRRERDGLILGAYEETPQCWSVDGVPKSFGMELLPAELERIEHLVMDAVERVPILGEAGIKTVVHGPVSYTPDGQPLIGPALGLRNVWVAAGSGFGIGEGAGAGQLLCEWMVTGTPPMDMLSFDPRRFGAYVDKRYRLAKVVEVFATQFATHYPFEEREAGRPSKTTPVYQRLMAKGARFGVRHGWERANWFAPQDPEQHLSFRRSGWFEHVGAECRAASGTVGIADLTGFSKYRVRGDDAESFLDSLSANRLPSWVGEIRLCHFLNPRGGIECEFTIARLGADHWYLVCAATAEVHHLDWLQAHLPPGKDIGIENVSESMGVLGVMGPRSRELLQTLCDDDVSNTAFPWLSTRRIGVAGVAVDAMRLSYTGELGWELHHPIGSQLRLYDEIQAQGETLGLVDVGFYAIDSMRLEKGYRAWGSELTVESTPSQAGLDAFVVCAERDFLGREAVLEQRREGVERALVCLDIAADDADAFGGEAVFANGSLAGVVTSGGYGHRVERSLALALLESGYTKAGHVLEVEILGERRLATVVTTPVYDPRNERLRA